MLGTEYTVYKRLNLVLKLAEEEEDAPSMGSYGSNAAAAVTLGHVVTLDVLAPKYARSCGGQRTAAQGSEVECNGTAHHRRQRAEV